MKTLSKILIVSQLLASLCLGSVTPDMGLTLPTVSVTPGPTWATQINAAFSLVDAHDHTTGKGLPVPSAGLSINADVSWGGYNLTGLRAARFQSQSSNLNLGADISQLYSVLGQPTWNDNSGTATRLLNIPTSFAAGATLYASSATAFTTLPIGTSGKAYVSTGTAPSWATLGINGGGTGLVSYSTGDLLYAPASGNSLGQLAIGSTGQVLKVSGGLPAWSSQTNLYQVRTITADSTALSTDDVILVKAPTGGATLTIPIASSFTAGKYFIVKKIDAATTNNVALSFTTSKLEFSQTSWSLTRPYESIQIVSDGTNWWIL